MLLCSILFIWQFPTLQGCNFDKPISDTGDAKWKFSYTAFVYILSEFEGVTNE
jgi:hypothetical protein